MSLAELELELLDGFADADELTDQEEHHIPFLSDLKPTRNSSTQQVPRKITVLEDGYEVDIRNGKFDGQEHKVVCAVVSIYARVKELNMLMKTERSEYNVNNFDEGNDENFDEDICNFEFCGIRVSKILTDTKRVEVEKVLFNEEEKHVWFFNNEDQKVSLPLKYVINPQNDVIIASKVNGVPANRLVIPGKPSQWMLYNITKIMIKDTAKIEKFKLYPSIITNEEAKQMIANQIPEVNEINTNSIIKLPKHGDVLTHQFTKIAGVAFTGGRKHIQSVELSVDGGQTWELCKIRQSQQYSWAVWEIIIETKRLGEAFSHVCCRAWDSTNNTQPNEYNWNITGLLNNAYYNIMIEKIVNVQNGYAGLRVVHPVEDSPTLENSSGWIRADLDGRHGLGGKKHVKSAMESLKINFLGKYISSMMKLNTKKEKEQEVFPQKLLNVTNLLAKKANDEEVSFVEGEAPIRNNKLLDRKFWVDFKLSHREQLSKNTILLRFSPNKPVSRFERLYELGLPVGQHISIAMHDPKTQRPIIRPYCPIVETNEAKCDFTLVVHVFPDGLMSNMLNNLQIDEKVKVRGPFGDLIYDPIEKLNKFGIFLSHNKIVKASHCAFICNSTGILPVFRVAGEILSKPQDQTRIYVLYFGNRLDDLILKSDLDIFAKKYSDRFQINYLVSEVTQAEEEMGGNFEVGFLNQEAVNNYLPMCKHEKNQKKGIAILSVTPNLTDLCKKLLHQLGYKRNRLCEF